ncbi:hypothetical protein VTK26DRAFT_2093 [Humicola hyalothermophila]
MAPNPAVFHDTMVSWLTDPSFHLPNSRIVGMCCSSLLGLQFPEESDGTDGVLADFRRLLLATSLSHRGWHDTRSITDRDVCAAGQISSGCRLIKRLDRTLTPQDLARRDRESCQHLFLLALGTVLGVGYSLSQQPQDVQASPFPSDVLGPELQRSPTLWLAMKEHLCQMLTQHSIFVGSKLGIKLDLGLEQRIVETAGSRWNEAKSLVWADLVGGGEVFQQGKRTEGNEDEEDAATADSEALVRGETLSSPPPEVGDHRPRMFDLWSENPQSYLSMFDEPDVGDSSPHYGPIQEEQGALESNTGSQVQPNFSQPHTPGQEVKRRRVWIVRPFDAGPAYGPVNAHARLSGGRGTEGLVTFL